MNTVLSINDHSGHHGGAGHTGGRPDHAGPTRARLAPALGLSLLCTLLACACALVIVFSSNTSPAPLTLAQGTSRTHTAPQASALPAIVKACKS